MQMLSPRQVHLDFHTSEWIEDVGAQFDAEEFARTVQEAAVSSMTVFARCHHGWLYYDSKRFPERVHPHLVNRNLMVDQVRALHARGIKAPVYITVQLDYQTAVSRPEWLIRKPDGAHEGGPFSEPGFGQTLCVNTGYLQYLREHTLEVMELLGDELDGLFFDIVGIRSCTCAACRPCSGSGRTPSCRCPRAPRRTGRREATRSTAPRPSFRSAAPPSGTRRALSCRGWSRPRAAASGTR